MKDNDYQGYVHDSDGWKILDPYGHAWPYEEYQRELESDSQAALDVPTLDIAPESVRDTEIRPEIEG